MEESKFHELPPLKRFKLIHQQQRKKYEEQQAKSIDPINKIPESIENTPLCLPAKKRKECRASPPLPSKPVSFCLPAKKRIWALQPFDLNLEYKEPISPPQNSTEIEESNPEADEENVVSVEAEDDDDGVVCAVCGSTDGDPTDPIVLCDGCDLMVHATCYGHPFTEGIPDGDWFCAQCLDSSKKSCGSGNGVSPSCCLCPVTGGALKPTTDGRWAHLVCAIYVPEVYFVDPEGREGIDCRKVLRKRWERKCCVCESRNGCAIDCSEPRCPLAFHVSCGLKEEFCIEYRQGKNRGAVVAAFCSTHTDLWKKQELTGKFKIVAREEK